MPYQFCLGNRLSRREVYLRRKITRRRIFTVIHWAELSSARSNLMSMSWRRARTFKAVMKEMCHSVFKNSMHIWFYSQESLLYASDMSAQEHVRPAYSSSALFSSKQGLYSFRKSFRALTTSSIATVFITKLKICIALTPKRDQITVWIQTKSFSELTTCGYLRSFKNALKVIKDPNRVSVNSSVDLQK